MHSKSAFPVEYEISNGRRYSYFLLRWKVRLQVRTGESTVFELYHMILDNLDKQRPQLRSLCKLYIRLLETRNQVDTWNRSVEISESARFL